MSDLFPESTREIGKLRRDLAPAAASAFAEFSKAVFAEGALSAKTKQLIAVAVAHVTQCPYCIQGHTDLARRHGASREEIMEAIWVAAEMRAGGAFAHSTVALARMLDDDGKAGAKS
jgi:AhpD family alkylhydroperoxidase